MGGQDWNHTRISGTQQSAVSIVIRLQVGWSRVFLFSEASRLVLGPTKPLIHCVPWLIPGGKVAGVWSKPHTPSSTMVKNERYTSTAPICLHSVDREHFTFFTLQLILKHSLEQCVIKNSVIACLTTPCLLGNDVSIYVTEIWCKTLLIRQPLLFCGYFLCGDKRKPNIFGFIQYILWQEVHNTAVSK
jgi:hypothetical protein